MAATIERQATTRATRTTFFVFIALAMLVVIALAFSKSFYARPLFTERPLPTYLVAHGVTMTVWYLLFLAQTLFVRAGRTDLHRKLGIAAVAVVTAVIVTTVVVNLNRVQRAEALGFATTAADLQFLRAQALDSMGSLIPLAILVVVALVYRTRPQVHRRLMFWAFVWTLGPAFTATRPLGQYLDSLVVPYLPFFPADLLWLVALVAFDVKTRRRVHPATYLGFAALAAWFLLLSPWIAGQPALQGWMQAWAAAHPYARG